MMKRESTGPFLRWSCAVVSAVFCVTPAFANFGSELPTESALVKTYSVKPVSASEVPDDFIDGNLADLRLALERQLAKCGTKNLAEKVIYGKDTYTLKQTCTDTISRFLQITKEKSTPAEILAAAKSEMIWYKSNGAPDTGDVKFTGYYFPLLEASFKKEGPYQYPFYRKPAEIVPVQEGGKTVWRKKNANGTYSPFNTREEIDSDGVLKGRGLEIAYGKDLFDIFIFQVQGSGSILTRDANGKETRTILNFNGTNGRNYISPRRILTDKGVPEEYLSIPGMKRYFGERPEELVPTLNQSPAYVFFQPSEVGPYGGEGVLITPGHSLAIDAAALPLGTLAYVSTDRPTAVGSPDFQKFQRFAVTQDIGGAIKTAGRVDFYWGDGTYAEYAAGVMNQSGSIYFMVKKPSGRPLASP